MATHAFSFRLLLLLLRILSVLLFFLVGPTSSSTVDQVRLDCDPCIDRSQYRIRAITHGRQNDVYWQDMRSAMQQTADDMGVDFEMILYDDSVDDVPQTMARDIRTIVAQDSPHALIVSLPGDSSIQRAIEVVQEQVPVFVVDSLTPYKGTPLSSQDMPALETAVYTNEKVAGNMAATEIRRLWEENIDDEEEVLGIYINHDPNIPLLTERYHFIRDATEDFIDWEVAELTNSSQYQNDLTALFNGCNYTVVQLSGVVAAEATLEALVGNGCTSETVFVGTYDTSPIIYDAIDAGMFHFAISQQPQYQGRLSVLFASLYATTGQTLAKVDGQRSELSSGPLLVTIDDIPATSYAMDRTSINIKVLTHDLVSDPFWDTIYAGLNQAANDFGVQLGTHRFKSAVSGRGEVSLERAFFIGEACRSVDIDGLIVSLPHENMVEALSECRARGIPVLALNAAPQEAIGLNLQYVGQMDYQSGREAGKKLLSTNVKRGWCLIHADLSSLKDRCRGMEDVFSESNEAEYMGIVRVDTNQEDYKIAVETTLGDGNWTDLGILSTGQIQISSLLSVMQDHPELKAGTFDVDPRVDSNLLVFAIDQQPYLQGYTAVAMMTWSVTTSDTTTSGTFSTGPKFDVSVPTQERRKCGETNFAVCQPRAPFPTLKYSGKCAELGRPCENCEGDCDNDSNCAEGLVCFVRDSKTLGAYQDVPGCSANPFNLNAKDFCVDAKLYTCADSEPFPLRSSDGYGYETCDFVARDLSKCTMYGIYCRETCGYCRPRPR